MHVADRLTQLEPTNQEEVSMGMLLSKLDRSMVKYLREDCEVLVNVDAAHLGSLDRGIIHVGCPDCDQFVDIMRHYEKMFRQNGHHGPRLHPLCLNGGPILIPEESPLNTAELPQGKILMHNIGQAYIMKAISTVALYAHAPCGAATAAGLSIFQVIDLLVQAKTAVKAKWPLLKVACFLHVDKGADGKKTYHVSRDRWVNLNKSTCWLPEPEMEEPKPPEAVHSLEQ